jgi:hypothetical protein
MPIAASWHASILILSLLASGAVAAGKSKAPQLMLFSSNVRLEVDNTGQVIAARADATLPDAVRTAIEGGVRQWSFSPPMRDGRPVAGVTYARLDACAAPVDGQYRFAIKYRGNGPAHDGQKFPLFPAQAMMRGDSARVKVDFRVMTDGTVTIDDMQFETGAKVYHRQYRQSIETWLKSGTYRPEELDGQPVVTRITLPVEFVGGQPYKVSSKSEAIAQGEQDRKQRAASNESCEIAMGLRDKADRQVALDSPFKPVFTN